MGGREVGGLANMLAGHMALENAEHRRIVQDFWQSPVVADRSGLKAVELFKAVREGRIKALWIMATSPVDSLPDADGVAEALEACPFVVVSEVTRAADTVPYANVLLPAAAWGEKTVRLPTPSAGSQDSVRSWSFPVRFAPTGGT